MSQNLPNMLDNTMSNIHKIVDSNSVIGQPITTPDGVTIIPVSKITIGFGGGGSDYVSKNPNNHENPFGGGAAGAIKVTPVAFLVVRDGNVRMISMSAPANTTVDRLVEMIPETVDKLANFVDPKKDKTAE